MDMNFVSIIFDIPLKQLRCYEKKQLPQKTLELLKILMKDERLTGRG